MAANLFTCGNDKVGRRVLLWNLPVHLTCPGATATCAAACYADRGHCRWPEHRARYARNLEASLREDFPALAVAELSARREDLARVHSSGDYYEPAYIRKWVEIAHTTPWVRYWSYTRSWRVGEMLPALAELASLDNFHLWFSEDVESGPAPRVPGVRHCWLQAGDEEPPASGVDLVFRTRTRPGRPPAARINGVLVCPAYNGTNAEGVSCDSCRYCFRR